LARWVFLISLLLCFAPPTPTPPPPQHQTYTTQLVAARALAIYTLLLDASSYGSFALSGGSLAASVAAGALGAAGLAAVEAAAKALYRKRLRAAGV
jgi:hypothetical protein